jgi:GTP-binding protein EngB required for normal cell division
VTLAPHDRLEVLADAARRAGCAPIQREVAELRERLSEGRFFVACVGQFKRGKSTLLNALVGQSVLPVGVVPVTSVVTVLRYGKEPRACVQFQSGDRRNLEPGAIGEFVSEEENPENQKGVSAVEVFLPCDLLRSGMCLVDTPGLGSVFAGNTEVTKEFVPHIDAALVVVGADPPLSGAELDLVEETAKHTQRLVFILGKADKLSEEERLQGCAFARNVLRRRLGRDVGPILEVSAVERVREGPTRDWQTLEALLLEHATAEVVSDAEERGVRRLGSKLLREIEEHRAALLRPQEESDRRVELLRTSVAEAERTLSELDYLFRSVQDGLAQTFEKERTGFLRRAIPEAMTSLEKRVREGAESKDLPARAMEFAQELATRAVDEWRRSTAAVAEALYAKGVGRFVEIANDFLRRVGDRADPLLASLPESFEPDVRFRVKPHFYFTYMMTLATPKLGTRLASITNAGRIAAVKKDAGEYLARLLETNSSRVVGDLSDQVLESRRLIQAEVREHLRSVVRSAEAAAACAAELRVNGEDALRSEVEVWGRLSADVQATLAR